MANVIMPSGKEGFATAAVNWPSDDIRVLLLSAGYVFDASHDFLNDIGAGFRVATSGALSGKTAPGGVLDADDITISAVSGSVITQGYYFKYNASDASARLLVYFDTATGDPFTPDGTDLLFRHADGADKIAAL